MDEFQLSSGNDVATDDIRRHYDSLTLLYRALWGDHLHHGYWDADETPALAQVNLVEKLVSFAGIPGRSQILDVGCGVGASSIWLAKHLCASVVGVTLSQLQATLATAESAAQNVEPLTRFVVQDANHLDMPDDEFDAVWVVESSEHIFDKGRFFRDCADALKYGGRIALATWLLGPKAAESRGLVEDIAERMVCPSFASNADITRWFERAGFTNIRSVDVTANVKKTWDYAAAIAKRPEIWLILQNMDRPTRRFVEAFGLLQEAFGTGAMSYGFFTAEKAAL